jgi:hypothetical protein
MSASGQRLSVRPTGPFPYGQMLPCFRATPAWRSLRGEWGGEDKSCRWGFCHMRRSKAVARMGRWVGLVRRRRIHASERPGAMLAKGGSLR